MKTGFDAIVVGAGMMGSAAARHLAEIGARVALVGPAEPRDWQQHSGPFASHYDEARITRKLDRNIDWSRLSSRSIARYRALEEATGIRFFHEQGAIMAISPRHQNLSILEPVRHVNTEESIGARDGRAGDYGADLDFLKFPTDTDVFFEASDAGYINPRAHVRAQIARARSLGAVRYEHTASRVSQGWGTARVDLDNGQSIEADAVLVACGGYTRDVGLLPAPLHLRVLARTIAFAELGEEEAERLKQMPSVIYFAAGLSDDLYILPPVRYPDGKLYIKIGGDPVDVELPNADAMNAWLRSEGDTQVGQYLLEELRRLIPDLRMISSHTASCATTYTTSGMPVISRQTENVFVLTGGNGAGAKNADELGRLGAMLVLRGTIADQGYACDFSPG